MRNSKQRLAIVGVVVASLALAFVPSAFAESPWWHLVSLTRPTNLHAGAASNEIQELAVAPETAFFLQACTTGERKPCNSPEFVGLFATEPFAAEDGFEEPTVANIQTALEAVYGAGNVVVSEKEAGSGRLTIENLGEDAFAPTRELETKVIGLSPNGAAPVALLSEGKPDGEITVTAADLGDADANGAKSPVVFTDVLPAGLKAVALSAHVPEHAFINSFEPLQCPTTAEVKSGAPLTCTLSKPLPPFDQIEMNVGVIVESAHTGEENEASIAGGEAPSASVHRPITVSGAPAPFGVERYELLNEEIGGAADTQAGSHPYQQTTTVTLNTSSATAKSAETPALAKNLNFRWPAGLIGDPAPFVNCTLIQFFTKACPAVSALGVGTSIIDEPGIGGIANTINPLYNVEPAPGQAARVGFLPENTPVFVGGTVRTGEDYGVTVGVDNIPQVLTFLSSQVTVWGVPGDASHDAQRGEGCLKEARGVTAKEVAEEEFPPCQRLETSSPPAFLTLPSACTGPMETTVQGESWGEPKPPGEEPTLASYVLPALDGCNREPFSPSIKVTPDGTAASTPTGLAVDLHVPQESTLGAAGLAESAVKSLSVALPEGLAVNPSSGDGLLACSQEQIALRSPGVSSCPEDAKVATVKIDVPVLPRPLEGAAYIAAQNANPFGSLLAMYIYAEDPISGVRVKSAGQVDENPATGQLTATFERDPAFASEPETAQFLPQAPFEDVEVHFFGGERAPLTTPAHCGAYTTAAAFTPWSAESSDADAVTVHSSSTFNITSGPHGSPCPGASLPFAPTLTGGTTNINAGAFSPLTTTISREDGNQNLGIVQLQTPAGLEGLLSNVKLCAEAQANEGTCGPESQIGETTVSAGVGSDPVAVKGGKVYITEKYEGAPFGLSIVNPVKAGPFDLEHDTANTANDPSCDCLVVRAKIEVNPLSGELTVTTNPTGPHAIPHIIDGIPVQIKRVNVTINRPNFTFNPTNCDPLAITATITSDEGLADLQTTPFQVANCALLKFNPKIAVSTAGHGSKANGASLHFKISYPPGAMGSQSWLKEAKFDIPKQLPARLETLQQSCIAATFEHDRAACPAPSIIGHAIVHTPVLPEPLEGPLYFVSFGNLKFPDAVLVLKGYGITIEQRGETFIDKKTGITSATFRAIPDVPFESLEVTLPTGRFSEFGVNLPKQSYDFCGRKLTMPTLFKASNGLEIHETTPIGITGCPKPKPVKKHKAKKPKRR